MRAAIGGVANWRLMFVLATDWPTISSLVTGGGTLVLAVATFAAVRSANRSARIAETALQEQRRPLLAPSRLDDSMQKLMFVDRHWVSAAGGRGVADHVDGNVYLAISLRNVGSGIGVCQGWVVRAGLSTFPCRAGARAAGGLPRPDARPLHPGRRHRHVAGGASQPGRPRARRNGGGDRRPRAADDRAALHRPGGLQRTITRFSLIPTTESWLASMTRHWYLDWDGPRPANQVRAAVDVVLADLDAAERRVAAAGENNEPPSADGGARRT